MSAQPTDPEWREGFTRDKDTEILDHLKDAVDQLDTLTERLKKVIDIHDKEDEVNGQRPGRS